MLQKQDYYVNVQHSQIKIEYCMLHFCLHHCLKHCIARLLLIKGGACILFVDTRKSDEQFSIFICCFFDRILCPLPVAMQTLSLGKLRLIDIRQAVIVGVNCKPITLSVTNNSNLNTPKSTGWLSVRKCFQAICLVWQHTVVLYNQIPLFIVKVTSPIYFEVRRAYITVIWEWHYTGPRKAILADSQAQPVFELVSQ